MNIILFDNQDLIDDSRVKISDRRQEHIVKILKSGIGDELRVGMLNGKLGRGRITEVADDGITLEIVLEQDPPRKNPITLISALPRPPVFRRIVSAVTSMGIGKIFFIQTARVEKSYWNSPSLEEDSLYQACILGLEQSCDTVLPQIFFAKQFKPFVEDALPGIVKDRVGLVAHIDDQAVPCPENLNHESVLAVGPEGGFTAYEVEKFQAAGFQPIHLGPRILRVEVAVQALIGRMIPIEKR